MRSAIFRLGLVVVCTAPATAAVNYALDDGRAELTIGIDPGEDQIWFNTFPVEPGGEVITAISAAFGRPGIGAPLNNLPIKVLLYEDLDGGSPLDATLLRSVDGLVAGANSTAITRYEIAPTEVHGTLLAAVLYRNLTGTNKPIASLDQTNPTFPGRSWAGWAFTPLDESNLLSIPTSQINPIEAIAPGNFVLRAEGVPIPEPGAAFALAISMIMARRRRGR